MREKDAKLNGRLVEGISDITSRLDADGFVDPYDAARVLDDLGPLRDDAEKRSGKITYVIGLVNRGLKNNIRSFVQKYDSFGEEYVRHNRELMPVKAVEVGESINPVEGYDLDSQQLQSIAFDIRSRLVIAGAGTGKTTTIVGLVKHLLKARLARPEEILLLSFTNASVNELRDRIQKETGQRIDTKTFHRLGLGIIANAEGKVPKITSTDLERFITEEMERRKDDREYIKALNTYIAYDYGPLNDETDFGSRSEYARYLQENPLITLNGEKVKSFGEADIANYLAVNGIPYRYEESYKVDTNDSRYGQYHPDFHITGTDIYIEYFGTDRDGNVARFMIDGNPDAQEEYRKGIEWKRGIHRENGTDLIEIYAYDRSERRLQEVLESKLRMHGVESDPESAYDALRKRFGQDDRMMGALVSMFTTVILLVKGRGMDWEDAFPKGKTPHERMWLKRLEDAIKPLYDAYQDSLRGNGEIDFEDMLTLAAGYVDKGVYRHPYRYVIVDEYQDLSQSRYGLLKSLRDSGDYRLFCVGDDWQSIYRFNGCDVSYILDFERYWGPCGICKIETTYRFSGDLLEMSSGFVCRNSRQYPKRLVGAGKDNCSVNPIRVSSKPEARKAIAEVLDTIPEGSSVLFLGRYNHDVRLLNDGGFSWTPDISDRSSMVVRYRGRPDLEMRFMTIHSSKGLQANYVFSLNNQKGSYGFPSTRRESPVISMLLEGEGTQMDEERRLFYVAMTRADRAVYILTYEGCESQFYTELFGVSDTKKEETGFCPICGGELVLREGMYGRFYGCSNYGTRGCRFKRAVDPRTEDI